MAVKKKTVDCVVTQRDKKMRIPSRGGLGSCEMCPYWNLGAYSNVTETNRFEHTKVIGDLDQRNVC